MRAKEHAAADGVTLSRLRAAHEAVAKLVAVDPAYVPIFERLESELAKVESTGDPIARARAIAAAHKAMA